MKNEQILGIIRHTLSAIGGFAMYKGYLTEEETASLTGIILTIIPILWSIWEKR